MRQTSIEWLMEQLTYSKELYDSEGYASPEAMAKLLHEAKQMHRKEIVDAINFGDERGKITTYKSAEQYYSETYGGEK